MTSTSNHGSGAAREVRMHLLGQGHQAEVGYPGQALVIGPD